MVKPHSIKKKLIEMPAELFEKIVRLDIHYTHYCIPLNFKV